MKFNTVAKIISINLRSDRGCSCQNFPRATKVWSWHTNNQTSSALTYETLGRFLSDTDDWLMLKYFTRLIAHDTRLTHLRLANIPMQIRAGAFVGSIQKLKMIVTFSKTVLYSTLDNLKQLPKLLEYRYCYWFSVFTNQKHAKRLRGVIWLVTKGINPEKIITKKATEFEMSLNACVSTGLICSIASAYFLL